MQKIQIGSLNSGNLIKNAYELKCKRQFADVQMEQTLNPEMVDEAVPEAERQCIENSD